MKQILFTCMLLLYSFSSISQNVYDPQPLFQGIPPSPDAASLGRYGQYPVSLYNGLVDIRVPIHTINLSMLQLPISLSYHASGIRVNDISSVVGLGWALNAGGVITRSVRGVPDAKFGISGTPYSEEIINAQSSEEAKATKLYTAFRDERMGVHDTESDVYYYNVGGLSGSFRFNTNGTLVQIPASDHKIEYTGGNYFLITASDGTIYTFGDLEKTRHPIGGLADYTSSWYLSSITTPDNKSIFFDYITDNTLYLEHYVNNVLTVDQVATGGYRGVEYYYPQVERYSTVLLSSIQYPAGRIDFTYRADRADRRKYRLSKINIINSKQIIKSVTLEHSYFTPTGVELNPPPATNHSASYNYRLKLDKVSVKDETNKGAGSYTFDYNTSKLLPPYCKAPSPDKRYYSQDYWGYYNGADNNNLLTYNNLSYYNLPYYPPANREVNTACAQACILNRITYPTGGYTVFEYESNKSSAGTVGGLRIKNMLSYHDQDDEPIVRSYQYTDAADNNLGNMIYKGSTYTQGKTVNSGLGDRMHMYDYHLSEPNTPLSFTDGSTVFYKKVTEFQGSSTDNNGKTEYTFFYPYNDTRYYSLMHCKIPTPQSGRFHTRLNYFYEDRSWCRGNPSRIDIYKKEGNTFSLIKSTQYGYRILDEKDVKVGFRSFPNYDTSSRNLIPPYNTGTKTAAELYQYTNILAKTGVVKLSEIKETTYAGTESITETTSYTYETGFQYEPVAIKQTQSDGSVLKSKFVYPKDVQYSNSMAAKMVEKNIVSQAIRQTDSLDNKQLRIIENNYSTFAGRLLPSSVTVQQGGGSKQTVIAYTSYDSKGNPTTIRRNDATNEAIIWGYNQPLPVAKLENITYDEISSTLMTYLNQLETITSLTNATEREKLRNINHAIRNNLPADVQVVTYTHMPLVGPTSYTDPQGLTTYYEYDGLGRIKEVFIEEKDVKKNIRTHTYNYYNN